MTVVIPVKTFAASKARLTDAMGPERRAELSRAMAGRTALVARDAGADVVIVAGDDEIADWAGRLGLPAHRQRAAGLNAAAKEGAAQVAAVGVAWIVLHADLPWLDAPTLRRVTAAVTSGPVIASSHDGGTSLLGGRGADFPFAYGPGSFQRHLAAVPHATVFVEPTLAMDLDQPRDLRRAAAATAGRWMAPYLT